MSDPESVFEDPEMVRQQMNLPAVIRYSFVGLSTPRYHAQLEEIVARIAGEENIRQRSYRKSRAGRYTAYVFEVFHDAFEDVESIYREVGRLDGTRFVV